MTEVVVLAKHSAQHFIVNIRALELFYSELFPNCKQNRVSKSLRLFDPVALACNTLLLEKVVPLLEQHVKRFRHAYLLIKSFEPI